MANKTSVEIIAAAMRAHLANANAATVVAVQPDTDIVIGIVDTKPEPIVRLVPLTEGPPPAPVEEEVSLPPVQAERNFSTEALAKALDRGISYEAARKILHRQDGTDADFRELTRLYREKELEGKQQAA